MKLSTIRINRFPSAACERFLIHNIRKNGTIDMVHFVLCNSGIPSFQFMLDGLPIFVVSAQQHLAISRHIRCIATNTGTSLDIGLFVVIGDLQCWIYEHLEKMTNKMDISLTNLVMVRLWIKAI